MRSSIPHLPAHGTAEEALIQHISSGEEDSQHVNCNDRGPRNLSKPSSFFEGISCVSQRVLFPRRLIGGYLHRPRWPTNDEGDGIANSTALARACTANNPIRRQCVNPMISEYSAGSHVTQARTPKCTSIPHTFVLIIAIIGKQVTFHYQNISPVELASWPKHTTLSGSSP